MSLTAGPHYQSRTVESLTDLACIVPENFTKKIQNDKLQSEDFAYVRDEHAFYCLDPDSLILPDVSPGYPLGHNVVFARTALVTDPALLAPPNNTIANIIGDPLKGGRWVRYGDILTDSVIDIPVNAGTGPVLFPVPGVIVGVSEGPNGRIRVRFSAGLTGVGALTSTLFEILRDGIAVLARQSSITLAVGATGTVTLEAEVPALEGQHTIQIRMTNPDAGGVVLDPTGTGHVTLVVTTGPF
jgi:hypothetical protein